MSGRSAAWLARLPWEQEVVGSNPTAPTIYKLKSRTVTCCPAFSFLRGFDDARLDTLFLALPISWKGTIQQYAGRLHRQYDGKKEVRIYDYLDDSVPMLARMYKRRLRGYKSIGYQIVEPKKPPLERNKR